MITALKLVGGALALSSVLLGTALLFAAIGALLMH